MHSSVIKEDIHEDKLIITELEQDNIATNFEASFAGAAPQAAGGHVVTGDPQRYEKAQSPEEPADKNEN